MCEKFSIISPPVVWLFLKSLRDIFFGGAETARCSQIQWESPSVSARCNQESQEYQMTRNYLDWLTSMPWSVYSKDGAVGATPRGPLYPLNPKHIMMCSCLLSFLQQINSCRLLYTLIFRVLFMRHISQYNSVYSRTYIYIFWYVYIYIIYTHYSQPMSAPKR